MRFHQEKKWSEPANRDIQLYSTIMKYVFIGNARLNSLSEQEDIYTAQHRIVV
jgi:hypothetical protein